ncbi:MAG: transporter permease [Paenibacillus sp.]|nr:transporter permease [Paenibacillus sp.]
MSVNLKHLWSNYNYVIIFLGIFVAFLYANGSDTSWTSLTNILLHSAILGTIALGMGFIILTGDIDLSVGSSFVLVGGLTIIVHNQVNNIFVSLVVAILLGMMCGFINGLLVGRLLMPSFIVTLATMLIFRSISQYMMNERGETRYSVDGSLSSYPALFKIGNGEILTLPVIGIVFICVAAILTYMASSTKFGKRVYALGSNPRAARLAGIDIHWTRVKVFLLSGALVGLAVFLKIAKDTSFDPATSGKNFELYAIAAVVIGGISMSGGRGKVASIVFGAMSFTMIDKIITAVGMNALLNDTVKGLILLAAVGLQMVKRPSRLE